MVDDELPAAAVEEEDEAVEVTGAVDEAAEVVADEPDTGTGPLPLP